MKMRRGQIATSGMSVYLSHRETNGTKRAAEITLAGAAGERIDDFLIEHGRRIPSGGVNLARTHVHASPPNGKSTVSILTRPRFPTSSGLRPTIPVTFATWSRFIAVCVDTDASV